MVIVRTWGLLSRCGKVRPNGLVLASASKKFEPHPRMVGGDGETVKYEHTPLL